MNLQQVLAQVREKLAIDRKVLIYILAAAIVGFAAGIASNFKLPPAPSTSQFELKAACTSTKGLRVELAWGLAPTVKMNRLERRVGASGNFEVIFEEKTQPFRTLEFTDTDVEAGTTYFYRLIGYENLATAPVEVRVTPDRCRETIK